MNKQPNCPLCGFEAENGHSLACTRHNEWIESIALYPKHSVSTLTKPTEWEEIARNFHDTYEVFAPLFGYETRKETRTFDPTSNNGRLMIATIEGVIEPLLTHAQEAPMGVSQWREHGKKYGYWEFFEKEARAEERKRMGVEVIGGETIAELNIRIADKIKEDRIEIRREIAERFEGMYTGRELDLKCRFCKERAELDGQFLSSLSRGKEAK